MPDASPAKWHLAHTTWFFETLVLAPHVPAWRPFDAAYGFLFNSYYEALGPRHERPRRGLLTRPTLAEIRAYRAHVDAAMASLLAAPAVPAEALALAELGCHHEQQHQELLLTDILHLFAQNPLEPACFPAAAPLPQAGPSPSQPPLAFAGGIHDFGHDFSQSPAVFAFDCEGPRHQRLLEPFRLAAAPVTAGEWLAFMADGGYRDPRWWLSDGWAACQRERWTAPLYWRDEGAGEWSRFTLAGRHRVDPDAPVCHVSFYEADAYARWSGQRLPSEFEWERAFAAPHPGAAPPGAVWEWTASPFAPYPRFRPAPGAPGEYNGKFMANQFVLRGGSWATPAGHMRPTYRNFFPPEARWQFSGLRLAQDA